jgi:hypothetical protein
MNELDYSKYNWVPSAKERRESAVKQLTGIGAKPADQQEPMDKGFYESMYDVIMTYFDNVEEGDRVLTAKEIDNDRVKSEVLREFDALDNILVPEDKETPSLDYYEGQDIDDTEDSVENQAQRLRDSADATFKIPTNSAEPGIMSKPGADGVQPTDGKEDKDIVKFIKDLTVSESSGDPTAEITIKDGRRFAGLLQFGEARLKDYQKATKTSFTQDDFIKDKSLQEKVALWHIKDIDKLIDSIKDKGKYTDRNGLRAVAHLGGKTGMKKFVKSQGKENPKDELGTSLQDYYEKFKAK